MNNLNLIDKFLLLALDDKKGSFNSGAFALTYGFAGAILIELSLRECIHLAHKKVVVNKLKSIDDVLLNKYFDILKNSNKENSLKHWIHKFGNKERDIKKETLNKLISKGILTKKEEKFLWLFNNNKFPTINSKPENILREKLYKIIALNKKPSLDELMLISLVDTCNLNKIVYGKEQYIRCKKNIESVISDIENSILSTTIKEVHKQITTMMLVIISASIATTTATN